MDTTFILVDPIKTEETNPLPDDAGQPPNGATEDAHELMQICSTCMTTSDVRPLPRSAWNWLTAITYGRYISCGVCTQCWPLLRRSLQFVDFVRTTQRELLDLESRNELNLAYIKKLNASTKRQPFMQLTTKSFSYFLKDQFSPQEDQNITDFVKLEVDSENSCHDNDNDNYIVENNSESDNEPITQKVEKNVQKNTNKKISLEELFKSDFSDDNDYKFGEEMKISDEEVTVTTLPILQKKTVNKKSDNLKNDNGSSSDEVITAIKPEKNKKKAKKPAKLTKAKAKTYDTDSDDSDIENLLKSVKNYNQTLVKDNSVTAEIARLVTKRIKGDPIQKPNDEKIVKYFEVKPFTVEEQKREMLNKKLVPDYENAMFKCETCYEGFSQEHEYEKHVNEHPKDGLTCRVCLKHCSTKYGFTKHIRWHLDRWIFSCKQCVFTTRRFPSAELHAGIHEGKHHHECNICGKVFARRPTFLSHMRLVHPSDHVCVLCGYSFIGERGIFCHRYLKHKGEDPTVGEDGPLCELCDIRFKTAEALANHERVSRRHGGRGYNQASKVSKPRAGGGGGRVGRPPNTAAPPCDYRARDQREPPISCEQCGQQYRGARAYRFHFARAHPTAARTVFFEKTELSLCNVCGLSVANLYNHMAQHAGGSFACGTCSKVFRSAASLRLHAAVHRAPQHQCPTCGRRFNQRANLNRHFTYAHTSIRDVKCDHCDKYFKSVPEMKSHVNYVHLKKPWPKKSGDRQPRQRRRGRGSDSDSADAFAGC